MAHAPEKIRNIMLAGHSGGGKTSLAEALLFATGAAERLGTIADGNTVMDYDPEEARRLASVTTAVAPLEYAGVKVNLIDVPGLFDFELGMHEGIKAAETVMIPVSARSGVSVGTQKANKLALRNGKARMFYISKMAVEHADFNKTFDQLKADFGSVCPVIVPVLAESQPTVYVDLINMKAFTYKGGKASAAELPENGGLIDGLLRSLNEAVAETDEELMEKFFMEEPFTHDEIVKGIRKGVRDGSLALALCGDSVSQEAIDLVLAAIKDLAPSPADVAETEATDKSGATIRLKCDPACPLAAYVFKTIADPFVGKLSYVKVVSGTLTSETIMNAETGEQERPGKLLSIKGKKQTDIKEITAGDIGAVTKLTETKTGHTLCAPGKPYRIAPEAFPEPSLSMALKSKKKGDESKISTAIQRLIEEDPTISYVINAETSQQVLSGLGEQHLDSVIGKMKAKFGVEVELVPVRVAYRETIRKKVSVRGRHKKQSGGHGQFGDVVIEFEPAEGEDLVFEEHVFGGAVPKNFFPAVEKGLRDSIKRGVVAGYPVVGLKATLMDGSYHPVDSSEMAFKLAASIAFKEGLPQASPILLEPIGALKAYVPDSNTGDLMGEVNKRRGRVLGMNPAEDGLQLVEAEVPMAEMSDFTTFIRSSTQGRGNYTFAFERYEPLPSQLEQKVIEEAKELREAAEE